MAKIDPARAEKMKAQKKSIADSQAGGAFIYVKADTTKRIRVLATDPELEMGLQVQTYFLNKDEGRLISPQTFGEPDAIQEYVEANPEEDPKILAKLKTKKNYAVAAIQYKSEKGGEVESKEAKLALMTGGVYQQVIDYTLDDEYGDPTNIKEGFDFKWTRTGSGMTDTKYTIIACKPTKTPEGFRKIYDLEALVRKQMMSYEDTQKMLKKMLGDSSSRDEEDDDKPKKSSKAAPVSDAGPGFKYVIKERDGKKVKVKVRIKPKGDL